MIGFSELYDFIDLITILFKCILLVYFGFVTYYDFKIQKIFNIFILFGFIFGLIYGYWMNGSESTIFGGLIGFSLMYILYLLGNILMPFIARRRGNNLQNKALYRNDVFFGLISGLILGRELITYGLFLSLLFICSGGILYLTYKIIKHEYHPELSLPVSPFMILGTLFILYHPFLDELLR